MSAPLVPIGRPIEYAEDANEEIEDIQAESDGRDKGQHLDPLYSVVKQSDSL